MTKYAELDELGHVVDRWETAPHPSHCAFPAEVEYLLARTGLHVDSVYGDFHRGPLSDTSDEMVWVARKPDRV